MKKACEASSLSHFRMFFVVFFKMLTIYCHKTQNNPQIFIISMNISFTIQIKIKNTKSYLHLCWLNSRRSRRGYWSPQASLWLDNPSPSPTHNLPTEAVSLCPLTLHQHFWNQQINNSQIVCISLTTNLQQFVYLDWLIDLVFTKKI